MSEIQPPFDCDAHIRPFSGVEIACELPDDGHAMHGGVLTDYAYPGSATTVEWARDDRRSFHGEWPGPCPEVGCVLPAGHPRGHYVE